MLLFRMVLNRARWFWLCVLDGKKYIKVPQIGIVKLMMM